MAELPPRSQVAFDSMTPLPSVAISQAWMWRLKPRHYLIATG